MSTGENPSRNWQAIAHELARETNHSKTLELSKELNQAMQEEERKGGATWFARDRQRPQPENSARS